MNDNKNKMIAAVLKCLHQGGAIDISDSEIERCMFGRVSEMTLIKYAKEFRDEGLIYIGVEL
jgi:hypothetical protein